MCIRINYFFTFSAVSPILHQTMLFYSVVAFILWSAFFWDITQRWVVVVYRRFGTTCRPHLQGSWTSWPLKMGPIGCHETSVQNYHSALRNIPDECRSDLHCGGSLRSQQPYCCCSPSLPRTVPRIHFAAVNNCSPMACGFRAFCIKHCWARSFDRDWITNTCSRVLQQFGLFSFNSLSFTVF